MIWPSAPSIDATDQSIVWRKSSRSPSQGGSCVEAGIRAELVAIRDSKRIVGPALTVQSTDWQALLDAIKLRNV